LPVHDPLQTDGNSLLDLVRGEIFSGIHAVSPPRLVCRRRIDPGAFIVGQLAWRSDLWMAHKLTFT
jgi:hypothetical protein